MSELQARQNARTPRRGGTIPCLVAVMAGLVVLLGASGAVAGSFRDDGSYGFDPAAIETHDFERGVPGPVDEESDPIVRTESDTALSGSWVVTVDPYRSADVAVAVPKAARTVRVSVWIRGGDAVGYFVTATDEHGRGGDIATLYPTGRITSDGWIELAADHLPVDGTTMSAVAGVFSPGGCEVDAFEVVVDGTPAVPVDRSCDGVADGGACGPGYVCYFSRCTHVGGWVPPIPDDRDAVADYLGNRLRYLFGPYENRALDLPAAEDALSRMKTADDRWAYWNGYMSAVRRLHDGHTGTRGLATFALENPKPINVCFLEGEADLTHGTAPTDPHYLDVLVSHVGEERHLGLGPGDRLVRVDGMHPITWARSLVDLNWSQRGISNHETFAEHASALRALIARFAHEIEIIDCDEQTQSCGEVETISIASLPTVDPDDELDLVSCDNRPLRHIPGAPADHGGDPAEVYAGLLLESTPNERIFGLEWESLYTTNGNNGVGGALQSALSHIDSSLAHGVILDHRKGTGGTFAGPAIIWDWAVAPRTISVYQARQLRQAEQPTLFEGQAIFQQGVSSGQATTGGSSGHRTLPIALLITEDVSASDWLPLGLQGADHVRIFGPYETNGAFSTRFSMSYWLGMRTVMASGDTFVADGRTLNGHGVEPDVVVPPKQSDLLVGIDTVHAAALSWVRQELDP